MKNKQTNKHPPLNKTNKQTKTQQNNILFPAKHKEELIQTFLMAGAKVNCEDAMKQTPLHIAAKNGRAENAILLTKKGGARADLVDSSGQTALHLAAAHDLSSRSSTIVYFIYIPCVKSFNVIRRTFIFSRIINNNWKICGMKCMFNTCLI